MRHPSGIATVTASHVKVDDFRRYYGPTMNAFDAAAHEALGVARNIHDRDKLRRQLAFRVLRVRRRGRKEESGRGIRLPLLEV